MKGPVLITGAAGIIGQSLSERLRTSRPGLRLIGVDRRRFRARFRWVTADLQHYAEVLRLLNLCRPATIFHCAGTTASGPWPLLHAAHLTSTSHLLTACLESRLPIRRVVILGSAAEYGEVPVSHQPIRETEPPRPLSLYGLSKAAQTALALTFVPTGVPVVVARLFNLVSPRFSPDFSLNRLAHGLLSSRPRPLRVRNLGSIRDFLPLEEAVRAMIGLADHGAPGETYNVCSGKGITLRSAVDLMKNIIGSSAEIQESAKRDERSGIQTSVGNSEKLFHDTGCRPAMDFESVLVSLLGSPV